MPPADKKTLAELALIYTVGIGLVFVAYLFLGTAP